MASHKSENSLCYRRMAVATFFTLANVLQPSKAESVSEAPPVAVTFSANAATQSVESLQLSSSGRWLAIVRVTIASAGDSSELLIVDLKNAGVKPTVVQAGIGPSSETWRGGTRKPTGIIALQWLSERPELTFVTADEPQEVKLFSLSTGSTSTIYRAPNPIYRLEWRPDFSEFIVVTRRPLTIDDASKTTSVAYRDSMSLWDIVNGNFDLPIYDVYRVGRRSDGTKIASIGQLPERVAWDSNDILLEGASNATSMYETTLSRCTSGRGCAPEPAVHDLAMVSELAVSRHGDLVFASHGPRNQLYEWLRPQSLYIVPAHAQTLMAIPAIQGWIVGLWSADDDVAWVEKFDPNRGGELVAVDWRAGRLLKKMAWPQGSLSRCSLSFPANTAVCIAETLTRPPMLVSIDLTSGAAKELPSILDDRTFDGGHFQTFEVVNAYGRSSLATLVVPNDSSSEQEQPLAVILGSAGNRFSRNSPDIPNYPVEEAVKSGISVLLVGMPERRSFTSGVRDAARIEYLDDRLSTLGATIKALEERKFRRGRTVLLGWSTYGLIAALAISRYDYFVGASIGDPATWGIQGYMEGSGPWQRSMYPIYGGPPDAQHVGSYLDFIPGANGDAPKVPIMLEMSGQWFGALEYLAFWRARAARVTAFIYPGAPHILHRRDQVELSQQRNLAWMKMNLFGRDILGDAEKRALGFGKEGP